MSRERTGFIGQDKNGRWFYRYQFQDSTGKRKNVRRIATSESNAKSELRKSLNKLDAQGEKAIQGERLKFSQLTDTYKEKRVFAAKYHHDRKVAGLRSFKHVEKLIETLKEHFSNKLVKSITHSDVERFKLTRLDTLKSNKKERTIASVNRELECLRSVMNFAKREGLILYTPFERGASLISRADENRREVTLSHDEEERLLAACGARTYTYKRRDKVTGEVKEVTAHDSGDRRKVLKVIIICALDTALRRNEILTLKWSDISFNDFTITVRAFNSKTARERIVGMTPRLHDELNKMWLISPQRFELNVFGYDKHYSTIKRAWANACRDAGLGSSIRFHDLRHTAISRLVEAEVPSATVMKISGHSQHVTFARYVNPTAESVKSAAMRLHEFNEKI